MEDEIQSLEAHLAGTLKPIQPPKDIILRLGERIRMPSRREITLRFTDWNRLFLIVGGVVSGMILIITIARALYYFAGRRDMM